MWGEISSSSCSSWGKETIGNRVSYRTRNKLKMTQAKILELRMEFLVDAISKCHMAVATRKRWKEIQASMDAVEIAWDRIKLTSLEFGSHDLNLDHLPMMVEMVLRKATKYLAKAQAKMEKWWEAQVQALED